MVAIPNHHFFQWVKQLECSGNEVYWFDITDSGNKVDKIGWVNQIKGWKYKYNYPFRQFMKKRNSAIYNFIQKYNTNDIETFFENLLTDINPDIVHCFEMKLSGLPILSVMNKFKNIKFVYSSWGSDMFDNKSCNIAQSHKEQFLNRVNFLITDCKRDYNIAIQKGYKNFFLGVFPGNGGININTDFIQPFSVRNNILIKGYNDGIGMASIVLKAIEILSKNDLLTKKIIIYSADNSIISQISESIYLSSLNIKIYRRDEFIPNEELLKIMGNCAIHIANSISDGMPNALLESMGMGAFPIQSNPGMVTEEIIQDGVNGFLIKNPFDEKEISNLIEESISNINLRQKAMNFNINYINQHYSRSSLKPKIVEMYKKILN